VTRYEKQGIAGGGGQKMIWT